MTPKRIRGKKKSSGASYTPPMKMKKGSKKPAVVIKKDARTEIVELNSQKLKKDITAAYEAMKEKGIEGNSGTAGFLVNRFELGKFVEKAKADGLTNAQALARFKKQFKM